MVRTLALAAAEAIKGQEQQVSLSVTRSGRKRPLFSEGELFVPPLVVSFQAVISRVRSKGRVWQLCDGRVKGAVYAGRSSSFFSAALCDWL